MFNKILIANRGEIACRIIQTAKKLGILSVAVYSDADKNSMHVQAADEAIYIGSSPASESYLVGDKILQAAKRTGAQAIHPGYGFLSENAEFCELCEHENIVFIGPPAKSIAAMGSKSAAKTIMEKASVPLVPGYHGDNQDAEELKIIADKMGYPILLKAAAGGGGRGMRPVYDSSQFLQALIEAKRESLSSFGDDQMLIERYLAKPRHVEVQVFCDKQGNGVYLFDRDCSVQRRHQKVIEEAPAPNLSAALRKNMGEAAVRAAQVIDYVGAGTVEFLVEKNAEGQEQFYFMEMNTRLQVEHPITEMITGQDLVEWQLRIASGENLPLQQEQLKVQGHAFESRIYAEDPRQNFCPSTGTLIHLQAPEENASTRVDTGVRQGDSVSGFYDPMIAKLITWDVDRSSALNRMYKALGDYQVVGVTTNIDLLKRISSSMPFRDADLDNNFIETHSDILFSENDTENNNDIALASLYLLLRRQELIKRQGQLKDPSLQISDSPWQLVDSWRLNQPHIHRGSLTINNVSYVIEAEQINENNIEHYVLRFLSLEFNITGHIEGSTLSANIDGYRMSASVVEHNDFEFTLVGRNTHLSFTLDSPDMGDEEQNETGAGCAAPMNGRVLEILVESGQSVEKGDSLVVMEAMKMEHTITAPEAGVIESILCKQDQLVDGGSELIVINNDVAES